MTNQLNLVNNFWCGDIPQQVLDLSYSMTGFNVDDGGYDNLGTPCCEALPLVYTSCEPTSGPTLPPSLEPSPAPSLTLAPTLVPTPALSEFDVLSHLYEALNGSNWYTKTNWLNGSACPDGNWHLISCSGVNVNGIYLASDNNLRGTIPKSLSKLSEMASVFIYENYISGSIPSELGLWSKLSRLMLTNNQLTGSVPSELGQLTQQTTMGLANMKLTGLIPSELGLMTSSYYQYEMYSNSFTGPMPSELGSLTKMVTHFTWNHNSFTGSVPSQLGRLTKITDQFNLMNNFWCGDIPQQVTTSSEFVVFDEFQH